VRPKGKEKSDKRKENGLIRKGNGKPR